MSKKIKILFSVSLILNFVFLGLVLGAIYKRNSGDFESMYFERRHKLVEYTLNQLVEKLPKNHTEEFKNKIQTFLQSQQDSKKEYFTQKQELVTLLKANNFDRDAYLATTRELNLLYQNQASKRAELISGIMSELSPEERRHVAEAVKNRRWFQ